MDGLRIRLFGGLTLEAHGEVLPPVASRSARSLLAYLVAHRHTAPTRDLLAGLFWPDMAETQARRRLSHALWQVQSVLNEQAGLSGYIQASPTTIRFAADADLWVDVDEFEAAIAALKSDGAPDRADTLARLVSAVGLYAGDFLAGFYDDWIQLEQERLRQSLGTALNHIVRLSKSWGDFDQALVYARRLALLDPLREEAHREVMRLCYLMGHPNEALAQYERCASILATEIGAAPAAETDALRREIADGRQAPLIPLSQGSRGKLFEGGSTPLVGRGRERQKIISHMEDALAGRGGIILLEGEAGAGKTRLLTECAEDANWRGLTVLWGGASPSGVAKPFEGLRQALEDGLTELRLHQLVERMDEVWLRALAPLLTAVARWAPDLAEGVALRGGTEERYRVREAFHRTFVTLARLTPTLLILDDVHRIDEDTLWALEAMASDLAETPLLICIAYRRDELEAQPRLWQTVRDLDGSGRQARLLLEPLSAAETGELVRRLLPEGSGANLVARLHAATGGNPLFMLETLRAIHERQVTEALKPATGLHALDAEDLPVSATVYELIAQRVAALPGESRHTAHALAVSGSGLDIDALTEVCELPRAQMLDAVDHLVSAGMITAAAGRYALAHDQLTEVTYDAMPAPERSLLHIGLARALEGAGSTDAETLGHHFRLGGAPTEATRYLEAAAREAARLSAFAAARDRYWEALAQAEAAGWSPAEQARLRLAQEQILEVLGEQQGRHRLLDELAVPAGADAALKAEVTQRRAWLLASVSQLAAAAETATAALDLHTSLGDSVGCARDLEALGTIAMWGSRNQEAVEWLESALVLAPDGSTLEAAIRNSLGDVLGHLHRFTEAEEQLGQARALFERHGDRRGLASILSSLAVVHGQRGDGDLAERTLLEAANLCEEIGYRYGMAINALNLGHHHFIAGQIARALPPADRARTVFQTLDNPRGLAMATANLASLHHAVGHDETAERLSCEALAIFDSLHHGAGAALCHGTLAEIARRRGDGPGAERELALGLSKATGLEATNARLQLLRTQSHLRLDAGDIEDGLRIAEQARRECLAASAGWLVSDLSVPLARALVLYGEPGRALEVTRSAGGVAEEPALLHWRMRALEAVGDHTGAQVTLESAHRAMLRQLDGFSPEEIAHTLAVVPQFRRVDELWAARRPRRLVVRLAAANAPTGRPVGDEDLIEVTWTIQHPLDEVHRPGPEMRATQLLRLIAEAEAAGAVPTIGDLAGALGVSSATVRRDLDALRRSGHAIRTRGRRR